MTSLHLGNNNIPVENMNEIIAIVEAKPAMKVLCAVPFRDKTVTELDVSGQSLGGEGALVIRRYLKNNGAMVKLNMSKNQIKGAEAGKALGDALAANTVLEELDLSENYSGPEFAKEFAVGLGANGALMKFTFSGDDEYDSKPVTIESSMTEADFSGKFLLASGAIMLAAFLPKCRYVQEYPSVRPLIYFLPSGHWRL